jgi:peptide-methionine (S)-S-oxide reductase
MYPNEKDLINSTAAARVNGYLAGYCTYAGLTKELSSLGLSVGSGERLLEIVRTYQQRELQSTCQIKY